METTSSLNLNTSDTKLRVLITGVAGRIGPHILPTLEAAFDLRTLDRLPLDRADHVLADLSSVEVLAQAMAGVDVVIHLAAQSDEAPFEELLVPQNVLGVHNVLEAAHRAKVRRVVFASTCQTVMGYGYPEGKPVATDDPVRPVTMYAATKVFGEALGRYYHDQRGLEFVAIRIGAFQPYDSPYLRGTDHEWARMLWLSPRDCADILRRAAATPNVGYAIVFGTSITEREILSRREAREILGFEPQDDIRTLAPQP